MKTVQIGGEYFHRYEDGDTYWMTERWVRWLEGEINRAWQWRRWGFDPPVGCRHSLSWQAAMLAMTPLLYALCELVAELLTT